MDIKKRSSSSSSKGGISGSPKKGGAGGKGTWGKPGLDDLKLAKAKRDDPDFESDDDADFGREVLEPTTLPVDTPAEGILRDFFVEAEESEVARRIKEENIIKPEFVRKAIYLSMDKKAYERELVSKLLSFLSGKTISSDEYAEGLQNSLDKLEDVQIDVPQAPELLGKFLARAVVDEIIPPSFLRECSTESKYAKEALALAAGLVNDPHRSRKLEHIWGPGDLESVKRLKQEVHKIVDEYVANEDKAEADQSLRKLNAPSFHYQVVRYSIRAAVESKNEGDRKKILDLLSFLVKEGLLSDDNVNTGFRIYSKEVNDHKLDVPSAPAKFDGFAKSAKERGLLSVDFK